MGLYNVSRETLYFFGIRCGGVTAERGSVRY